MVKTGVLASTWDRRYFFLRLKLPNGENIILPGGLSYKDRLKLVQNVLKEYEDYYIESWETNKTKTSLDMLSNYLAKAKDFKDTEYTTASVNESAILEGRRRSKHYIRFSDLPLNQQHKLGIKDYKEDAYE